MKKSASTPTMIVLAALTAIFIMFTACEDEPSMSDLDSYFANNPFISDPRVAGNQALDLNPQDGTVTEVGDQVAFIVSGGRSPYLWASANDNYGTVTRSESRTESAVYKANVLADNSIIVYDDLGRAAVANINASEASLTLIPDSATISNQVAGDVITFTAIGGAPPYTWYVSFTNMGYINDGAYTVFDTNAIGVNTVTVKDQKDATDTATVTHE